MTKKMTVYEPGSFAVTRPGGSAMVTSAFEQGITVFQLTKIKVPAGGGIAWTIPTLDGDEAAKDFDCVIAYLRGRQKAWWREDADDSANVPPSCASTDGIHGIGNNSIEGDEGATGTHECAACLWSKFGSSRRPGGLGKDCKDFAQAFLFREGSHLPTMLSVPPTSLKGMQGYLMKLLDAGRPIHTVTTRVSLRAEKASNGKTYSQIDWQFVNALPDDEAERMGEVADVIRNQVASTVLVEG